ncbi:hypothetical protein [Wielerella bovis]|uniref:hypothetical protein n=1 Tax=Wielerella bovis TaxID=2917790 RepID=UPI0020184E88|nr:hypothetical protein [Wielerella bovis]ULJ61013.1 hypothetical protein MIS44_03945 [Wielerella bovis]
MLCFQPNLKIETVFCFSGCLKTQNQITIPNQFRRSGIYARQYYYGALCRA